MDTIQPTASKESSPSSVTEATASKCAEPCSGWRSTSDTDGNETRSSSSRSTKESSFGWMLAQVVSNSGGIILFRGFFVWRSWMEIVLYSEGGKFLFLL